MLPLEFAPCWIAFLCSFLFFLFTSCFLPFSLSSSVPLLLFFFLCTFALLLLLSFFLFLFCSFFFCFYFSFSSVFSLSSLFLFFLLALPLLLISVFFCLSFLFLSSLLVFFPLLPFFLSSIWLRKVCLVFDSLDRTNLLFNSFTCLCGLAMLLPICSFDHFGWLLISLFFCAKLYCISRFAH